jgi:hypothetical protein
MRLARMRSCSVFTNTSWCRKIWGKQKWQGYKSWESGCGFCCVIKLITKSSAVAERRGRKAVVSARGCQISRVVQQNRDRITE